MNEADELRVELAQLTKLTPERWAQIFALPRATQAAVLEEFKDQDWRKPGMGAGDRVLQILDLLARIGGDVSGLSAGVGGAAGVIAVIKAA